MVTVKTTAPIEKVKAAY